MKEKIIQSEYTWATDKNYLVCRSLPTKIAVAVPEKQKMVCVKDDTLIVSPTMSWNYKDFSADPELIQIFNYIQTKQISDSYVAYIHPVMIALLEKS